MTRQRRVPFVDDWYPTAKQITDEKRRRLKVKPKSESQQRPLSLFELRMVVLKLEESPTNPDVVLQLHEFRRILILALLNPKISPNGREITVEYVLHRSSVPSIATTRRLSRVQVREMLQRIQKLLQTESDAEPLRDFIRDQSA